MHTYPTKDTELGGEVVPIQSSRVGEINYVAPVNDEVFGQLEKGAPNYRNVSLVELLPCPPESSLISSAWLDWYHCPHDEDTDRLGCSFHPIHLQHPRNDTWNNLPYRHRSHHYLVRLHCRSLQDQPSRGLWH